MWPGDLLHMLFGLGAVSGLIAATQWLKVTVAVSTASREGKRPDLHALGTAATFTTFALGLASVGYLAGRFYGLT